MAISEGSGSITWKSTQPKPNLSYQHESHESSESQPSSALSVARHIRYGQRPGPDVDVETASQSIRQRRSSFSVRINSLTQVGGPNSLENFARSWSRAAGFLEIQPKRTLVHFDSTEAQNENATIGFNRVRNVDSPKEIRSLLRQELNREGQDTYAIEDDDDAETTIRVPKERELHENILEPQHASTCQQEDSTFRPLDDINIATGSQLTGYGSLSLNKSEHFSDLGKGKASIGEGEPLLVKVVKESSRGRVRVLVIGRSTLPQTIFNSVNVLVGIGLLSLPLGLKQAGWLIGMTFLLLAAIITRYTARILAKCLDLDQSLLSFSDIAWKAFGSRVRVTVGLLFSLELLMACVALVVLFADSLNALLGGWSLTEFKLLCGLILMPLSFLPLRYLSFTSVLGIISCFGIVTLIFVDGLVKTSSPGSLRHPARTYILPERLSDLPLSFGLLLSPWGGHSVFPNVYRDMSTPKDYGRAVNYTYAFTYMTDIMIATIGYLMFGDLVRDEVTSNILLDDAYPPAISLFIIIFIAIIPLTKLPLNVRPIFTVLEEIMGLHTMLPSSEEGQTMFARYKHEIASVLTRVLTLILIVAMAIAVPSFDTIMALLGSAMTFSICIILPIAFHLKLFGNNIGQVERYLNWTILIVSAILATTGTVWVFLPDAIRRSVDGDF